MQHNYLTSWNAFCLSVQGNSWKRKWNGNEMFALQINHQSSKVLATCMIHDLQQNSEIQLHYAGFPMQINRLSITVD